MSGEKVYTLEDISGHNTLQDTWLAIEGKVYDVSKFLDEVSANRFSARVARFHLILFLASRGRRNSRREFGERRDPRFQRRRPLQRCTGNAERLLHRRARTGLSQEYARFPLASRYFLECHFFTGSESECIFVCHLKE